LKAAIFGEVGGISLAGASRAGVFASYFMKAGEMRRVMSQNAKSSNAPLAVNIKAKGVYGGIRHNSMLSG
jgi:hypothetical protein